MPKEVTSVQPIRHDTAIDHPQTAPKEALTPQRVALGSLAPEAAVVCGVATSNFVPVPALGRGRLKEGVAAARDHHVKTHNFIIKILMGVGRAFAYIYNAIFNRKAIAQTTPAQKIENLTLEQKKTAVEAFSTYFSQKERMSEVGIFRTNGQAEKIKELYTQLSEGKFDAISQFDLGVVTSAFKAFTRDIQLFDPKENEAIYPKFIAAGSLGKEAAIEHLQTVVRELPEDRRQVLNQILNILEAVKNNAEINKMTATNLGICFGPNLIRSNTPPMTQMADMKAANAAMALLIDNKSTIMSS